MVLLVVDSMFIFAPIDRGSSVFGRCFVMSCLVLLGEERAGCLLYFNCLPDVL